MGRGRIIWGRTLEEVLVADGTPADVEFRPAAGDAKLLFTHRSSAGGEIYFLSNQKDRAEKASDLLTCRGIRVNPSGDKSGGVWWWESRFPWR